MKVILVHHYNDRVFGVKLIEDDVDEVPIIEEHLKKVAYPLAPTHYTVKLFDAEGNSRMFGDLIYYVNRQELELVK